MPTPQRQRPAITSPLAPKVEPIGPSYSADLEQRSHAVEPESPPQPERRKRSFVFPVELIARAQRAQKISDAHPGGYESLNALVIGAIEHELDSLADIYNSGQPIQPFSGEYRKGRATHAGR